MSAVYFPRQKFAEALSVTSKLKQRLTPFIEEISNNNIQWTFFICSQLYQYLISTDSQTHLKFNSLATLKLLIGTCEFSVILITEVYFLPVIWKIATYQLTAPQKVRGIDYFPLNSHSRAEYIKKLGYNFVRLACQIISILAVIKPYRVYKNIDIPKPSEFSSVLQSMKDQGWKQYDQLAFYTQNPLDLRELFQQKIEIFTKNMRNYENFVIICFNNIIRKDLYPTGLDIRKILEFYEPFACSYVFESLRQMCKQKDAVTLTNVLKAITDFVRWGNLHAFYLVQLDDSFSQYFNAIPSDFNNDSNFRKSFTFEELQGSSQEKKDFYQQLLRSLQIWTVCIAKDLIDFSKESKVTSIFKKLKYEKKIEFPYTGNLKKIRNQSSQNVDKHKYFNQMEMNFCRKGKQNKSFARRDSTDLKKLMRTDSNNMKSLFNESRKNTKRERPKESSDSQSQGQDHTYKQNTYQLQKESTLRKNSKKQSTFASAFFKQKRKKKRTAVDYGLCYTISSNSLDPQTSEVQKIAFNFGTGSTFKNLSNLKIQYQNKSEDDSEDELSDTDYSNQIEEGTSVRLTNPLKEFKPLSSLNNNQSSSKESSFIEFFGESDWSLSSIASEIREVKEQKSLELKINVFQPHKKNDQNKKNFLTEKYQANASKTSLLYTQSSFSKNNLSIENYFSLEQKVLNLQEEKQLLRLQVQEKNKQIQRLKKKTIKDEGNKDSWSKLFISEQSIRKKNSQIKIELLNESNKSVKSQQNVQCSTFLAKYIKEMQQLSQNLPKKLLKKKDLLIKNDKIEVGYILQTKNNHSAELTLFITPQININQVTYELKSTDNLQIIQLSEKMFKIDKGKQKKLYYKLYVKSLPYIFPQFCLGYNIQGKKHSHNINLPLSFNKFVILDSQTINTVGPIIKSTNFNMINKNVFKSTVSLHDYMSDLNYHKSQQGQELTGSCILFEKKVNIKFLINNSQQVKIQVSFSESERDKFLIQAVYFLISTWLMIIKN